MSIARIQHSTEDACVCAWVGELLVVVFGYLIGSVGLIVIKLSSPPKFAHICAGSSFELGYA